MNQCQTNLYLDILARLEARGVSPGVALAKHVPENRRKWLLEHAGDVRRPVERRHYAMRLNPLEIIEVFCASINVSDNKDECWTFAGYCNPYGQTYVSRQLIRAHVLMKSLWDGLPYGYGGKDSGSSFAVRHKCDNPACCNPHHLENGTMVDNIEDRFARGRATHDPLYGTKHICPTCSIEFDHVWAGHKYCSRVCYNNKKRPSWSRNNILDLILPVLCDNDPNKNQ